VCGMAAIELLPLEYIASDSAYVLFSKEDGIYSNHQTATEAIKAFTAVACRDKDTPLAIYKREADGWTVF